MNLQTITQTILLWGAAFGVKILGAIALWVIGRWLIHFSIYLDDPRVEGTICHDRKTEPYQLPRRLGRRFELAIPSRSA